MKLLRWTLGHNPNIRSAYVALVKRASFIFSIQVMEEKVGGEILPHKDMTEDWKSLRVNFELKRPRRGGEFVCDRFYVKTPFLTIFSPTRYRHYLEPVVDGKRLILSFFVARKKSQTFGLLQTP